MADDLARRIRRQQDALRDGDIDDDDFAKFIAKLRAQYGDAAVDGVLNADAPPARPGGTTQIVTGTVGAAVGGDVYGNIYINGHYTRDQKQLLRAYLTQIQGRCRTLPLQGVHEQRSSTDVLDIKLDRVYTQLATSELVERERFARAAMDV